MLKWCKGNKSNKHKKSRHFPFLGFLFCWFFFAHFRPSLSSYTSYYFLDSRLRSSGIKWFIFPYGVIVIYSHSRRIEIVGICTVQFWPYGNGLRLVRIEPGTTVKLLLVFFVYSRSTTNSNFLLTIIVIWLVGIFNGSRLRWEVCVWINRFWCSCKNYYK